MGYPATKRTYVISRAIESLIYKDQLAVGIAIYYEESDWHNTVSAIIFDNMPPLRIFLIRQAMMHREVPMQIAEMTV